ncbi:MAG: ubiquinol oxidase subunit II [Candidatus Thiodiazotropha sp.]
MPRFITRRKIPGTFSGVFVLLSLASPVQAGNWLELDPQGVIAQREDHLLLITLGLMLIVVIPVLAMTLWFAWHYRAGNHKARYMPEWSSVRVDVWVWVVPALIVAVLAVLTWTYTHRLNPYAPLESTQPPLKVQVVALDWKWLFIYPEQGLASVNKLVIPVGRPVSFDITSDTVMNAFFIPQLGGQIYAMAGMRTELHLRADHAGTYFGENTQYSGRGFPYQNFKVIAKAPEDFQHWVQQVGAHTERLDWSRYERLQKPSVREPVQTFAHVDQGLFDRIMNQYMNKPPAT